MLKLPIWYEKVEPYLYIDKESELWKKYKEKSIRDDAPEESKRMYEKYIERVKEGMH